MCGTWSLALGPGQDGGVLCGEGPVGMTCGIIDIGYMGPLRNREND